MNTIERKNKHKSHERGQRKKDYLGYIQKKKEENEFIKKKLI